MARSKIREYHGKQLLRKYLAEFGAIKLDHVLSALVTPTTDWEQLKAENPWLLSMKLIAKPDMLFGKRGKYGLVKLNATVDECAAWIAERMNKDFEIEGITSPLTHFILEPFVPHKHEFYVSILANRLDTQVCFSPCGGVEIEENWETVKQVNVPVGETLSASHLDIFRQAVVEQAKGDASVNVDLVIHFVETLFRFFSGMDFTSIEINPFALDGEGRIAPLDLVAEVDDTALFKNRHKWANLEFPEPFGRTMSPEERFVSEMDEKTGASLKLTILNPTGRIWNLVAGGGASVIFADTVCDLGFSHELANYGEYSGAPNEEETFQYAKTMIDLATRHADGKSKALLIGGGIANFTDIAKTFKGIIHALEAAKDKLVACNMRIYVRRAGPNYRTGLRLMRDVGERLGVHVEVYGPETTMTFIVKRATDDLVKDGSITAQ